MNYQLSDLHVINIEKRCNTLCDEAVIQLPLFSLSEELVWKSDSNSEYVLTSPEFMNALYIFICPPQVCFTLNQLERINKYWNICVEKDLDYMKIKFK